MNCRFCGNKILGFRDVLSRKEFGISELCQECQDKVFVDPEEKDGTA